MEVPLVPVFSTAVALLLTARSATSASLATASSSQTGGSSDTNGQRLFRMLSRKLHNQCLQMDTLACLGLKVLISTARQLDSPLLGEAPDERSLGEEADVEKILVNNVGHYIDRNLRQGRDEKEVKKKEKVKEEMETADEGEYYGLEKKVADFARGSFFSRKMLVPLLVGIMLKLASLIPLVLGKLTFIGSTSFLSSKLALLIIILMNIKKWLSGGTETAGHAHQHSMLGIPQFFQHHDLEGQHSQHYPVPHDYPDLQQGAIPMHPPHPIHPTHQLPHSGVGMGVPHLRKTFIVRGRQLGDEQFWSSGVNKSEVSETSDTANRTSNFTIHYNSGGKQGAEDGKLLEDSHYEIKTSNLNPSGDINLLPNSNEKRPLVNHEGKAGNEEEVKEGLNDSQQMDRNDTWKPSKHFDKMEAHPNVDHADRRAEYILRSRQMRYKDVPSPTMNSEEHSGIESPDNKQVYNYKTILPEISNKYNKYYKLALNEEIQIKNYSSDDKMYSTQLIRPPSADHETVVTDVSASYEVPQFEINPQGELNSNLETDGKHNLVTSDGVIISEGNLEEFEADRVPLYPSSMDITLNDEEHYGEEIPDGFDMEPEDYNSNDQGEHNFSSLDSLNIDRAGSDDKNSIRRLDSTEGEHVDVLDIRRMNNPRL